MEIMKALQMTTAAIKDWANTKIPTKLTVDEDNMLYLSNEDGVLSEGIQLPQGGGGSGGYVTVKNKLPSTTLTIASGGIANLIFEYRSTEDDGNGTVTIYVSGNLKDTFSIIQGDNTIDVSPYIGSSGGAVDVKITCADAYGNQKSLTYTINIIELKITSSFDDSQLYSGNADIRYIVYGAVEKSIIFELDGEVYATDVTSETGKQRTFTIEHQPHGAHTLKIYAIATVSGVEIKSNELIYDIMFVDDGATTPIISSACDIKSITQGENVSISYTVYDPANMETNIKLTIKNGDEVYSTSNRIVDRTRQVWNTRDYPLGNISFIIEYGVISKTHIINVNKNDIDISIKNTDLEFYLKAAGKSNEDNDCDIWTSNDVTTTFNNLNWDSTGWIDDEYGDTALRLAGDSTAIINFMPFKSDARQTGRTLEMEFAIRDVNNRNAIAISCINDGIGFTVTADTAKLTSEQTEIKCNYTDEEKVYVTFVIEPRTEYRLMSVYLNGVLSGTKQYPETDNMQQTTPVNITVGSPYCSVDLYAIRSYNTALIASEVRDNYIADITDIGEQLAVYSDNDIYDIYGNLSFSKLQNKLPIMVITGDLPKAKGDKKSVVTTFTHPQYPQLNFEDSGTIDVQGTSSQFFIRKNYKIKYKQRHQHAIDQLPSNVFTWKADYAEATGTHNTGSANYVHTLYGDTKTPPQENNDKIRTTVYGYPALIFHKADSSSEPEFLGKYNANFDKGSNNVYGFTDEYPLAESWEFLNNTSDACLFHGQITDSWEEDFEARYPDEYTDISKFKVMHDWVVSTWQNGATGNALGVVYTDATGNTYSVDTAEYRLAKFKKEFTEHFDFGFCLIYYLYTFVMLMVDQRAKNMFLTSWDGVHYQPWFYDNDTILGINNEGVLVFDYYHEDNDQLGTANVFNGAESALWTNFREAFANEIKELYQQLRSSGKLSYNQILEYFVTRQSDKWSISIYNEDSDFKYISMLRSDNDATNLYQVRGTGEEHLKYFVKNRLMYCDSKWYGADYADDIISLRIYTPSGELAVPANADITVTPFSDIYAGVRYKANAPLRQQRAKANTSVTFKAPDETFNDTETGIYGASEISSVGDLAPLYCGTVNVSKAKKLTELIVGSGVEGYSNPNLKELAVGTNKLLKKIDIRNCPNYTSSLQISNCPNIQEIYATGSGITGLELPDSGYLKKVYLPETLTNLTVTNQQYIEEFHLAGYDALTTLRIEKTVNIPVEDIMLNAPNLNRVRLLDVTWEAESEAALVQTIEKFKSCLGLDASGNNTDKAIVTGRVKVHETVSDATLGDIYNNFPDLVVDDGSTELFIINYKNWDGTILYTDRLAEGEDAIDPVQKGYISEPSRDPDSNYSYEYVGWSTLPTNVTRHYVVTAQYKTMVAVNFCVDGAIIHSEYVVYGSDAEDPVANGTIDPPTKEGTDDLHYVFDRWGGSLTNVTLPRSIEAIFANVYPVRFYATETSTAPHYVQWVQDGYDAFDPVESGDCEAPTKEGTSDMYYTFSNWASIPTSVTAIMEVYAEYIPNWAVRFYNGDVVENIQWIRNGQSAVDPVTAGIISTPQKASTAQYDYTFSGWSGDYTNVTAPVNVIATYSSTVRKYSVYFYNGDDLIYTVENVPYGGSTSYSGSTPVKTGVDNPEEYEFKRWNPAPTNITGTTKCYALFKFTGYIKDDWATINENALNGTAETLYQIGGRKEIPITLSDGTETIADVELIAFNHDDLADGTGKASLTFFCKDLPNIQKAMNPSSSDVGGWESSEMRTFVNGELFNALPSELQAVIKPVSKISDGSKVLITTTDKLWLASFNEVGFTDGKNNLTGQGELYSAVFSSDKESRKKYITDDTDSGGWWLRSTYYTTSSNTMFWRVQTSGASYGDIQSGKFYVAFGFCI